MFQNVINTAFDGAATTQAGVELLDVLTHYETTGAPSGGKRLRIKDIRANKAATWCATCTCPVCLCPVVRAICRFKASLDPQPNWPSPVGAVSASGELSSPCRFCSVAGIGQFGWGSKLA